MQGLNIKEQRKLAEMEDAGTDVHIDGVDGNPLYYVNENGDRRPVLINVAGTNSALFREIEAKQRKRRIKPRDFTAARAHLDGIEKVAFCTKSWEGVFDEQGNPIPCSFNNACDLYKELPHVYALVVEAMGDSERFFGNSSPD